jgi:hypothetical protein
MHRGVNAIPVQDVREAALGRFDALRERLAPELEKLLACGAHTRIITPGVKHVAVPKKPGVYLFTEHGEHRYVGRSKNLNSRFGQHIQAGSGENSAPFAFNIARRDASEAGFPVAGRTRTNLGTDPEFKERFFAPATQRLREMDFRFVIFDPDEPDVHVFSTVFEVYAAMVLGTDADFNLFHTH